MLYQASYRVDKTGGTLSSGSDSGKTSLSYEVTSAAQYGWIGGFFDGTFRPYILSPGHR